MALKDIVNKVKKEIDVLQKSDAKDKHFVQENQYPDVASAQEAFKAAKQKLFDVNKWSDLPGISSTFERHNPDGQKAETPAPQVGDFIRIKLPGIPVDNWVQVTDIQTEETAAQFTVKPSPEPNPAPDSAQEVKHFFGKEASSTFRVELAGTTLRAEEIGHDEMPNNQEEEAGARAILNTLVAAGGWAGFQKLQWDKLTTYLVHKIETGS
ncbi:MAG: hypothetical protein COW65_02990 [Cytophagales bacterium CG18_big_fil_WC_8_21_14_2_50_42_9]|nr:MAG: hypothetical protein COW65_02990 [Cytophagales bacterium CG18_big_fil_WC_8_21_14_2_50_42_9]